MLVHELQEVYTELSDWKVPLKFIANGTLESLPKLRKNLGFSQNTKLYTDPSLTVYRNAGLEYGLYHSFGPQALFNIGKGLLNGFMQTRLGNNLPQQSGVFLFGQDQKVIWSHKNKHIGDLLDVNSLLEQILIHKSSGEQK